MSVEKRLTDVRQKFNIMKFFIGIIFVVLGIIVGYVNYFFGMAISIILSAICTIIGSYLLATCQSLAKDIALKVEDKLNRE